MILLKFFVRTGFSYLRLNDSNTSNFGQVRVDTVGTGIVIKDLNDEVYETVDEEGRTVITELSLGILTEI